MGDQSAPSVFSMENPQIPKKTSEESRPAFFLAAGLMVLALGLFAANKDSLLENLRQDWLGLVFWGAILVLVSLFPVHLAELTLTLDMPILVALVVLYPPDVAAAVALVAGVDVREFSGAIGLTRAVFNRAQIAISVFVSGAAFGSITTDLGSWPEALVGMTAAMLAFHSTNAFFVSGFTALRTGRNIRLILRQMMVGGGPEFFAMYFSYGALALGLAFLFENLGPWSVVMFLAPLLVARQALVRVQNLQALTETLKERESMLQKLFARIAHERKDERTRIAFGLHDDILHSLVRIAQLGGFIKGEVDPPPEAADDLRELTDLSTHTADKVRLVIGDLQSSVVGIGGLVSTLSGLVRDLEARWRRKIRFDALMTGDDLSPEVELTTYQVVKEALDNALRHSQASEVCVTVAKDDEELLLNVSDNGIGFDLASVDRGSHFGLGLLEARVGLSGGVMKVRSSPGHGTDVQVRLGLNVPRPEEPILDSPGLI